jgi:hypothetical protein
MEGGTEDNDLWSECIELDGTKFVVSVWEPTVQERSQIAAGQNIRLYVMGEGTPPIAMTTTDEPLGAPPAPSEEPW